MKNHQIDLGELGFDRGGHLLIKRELKHLKESECLTVTGRCESLKVHLRAWCRSQGHHFDDANSRITTGSAHEGRWRNATRAGHPDSNRTDAISQAPPLSWGLAARGALVEQGTPDFDFSLTQKDHIWAQEAEKLYKQAAAAQWDPETKIDWSAPITHPQEVEDAVVQVMTYLIENETVALLVPARFLAKIHPHFREVMQLLAIQAADEARHIDVFTRRALLNRDVLGVSTVGGQESLKTLLDEPDFALASFLLSVLGEGSFLSLLWFLRDHAPDPITRQVASMSATDEARHVAFGMAHLARHARIDSSLIARLSLAVERRHQALVHTSGLNEEVFDALVLLAAGSWAPEAIKDGWDRVFALKQEMAEGRVKRMMKIGFSEQQATKLASLHTRNFM